MLHQFLSTQVVEVPKKGLVFRFLGALFLGHERTLAAAHSYVNDMPAVDHIDLRIPYGQIFGLLGPNGAGKSTTIKMLTTLLDPFSGETVVTGFDVVKAAAEARRRIGYVPPMLSADGR